MVATIDSGLAEDLIVRCGERAPKYDRENMFFSDDF